MLAAACLLLATHLAHAGWACDCLKAACPPRPCPPVISWEERSITCYKPVLKPRDVECQVTVPVLRPEITREEILVPKLVWSEQKRVYCEPKRVPREVEREEVYCRMVTEVVTDPCTGCAHTICKSIPEVKKVKVTVWDLVMEPKEMVVRTACLQTAPQTIEMRRLNLECKPGTVIRRHYDLELVPIEVKIRVPVCVSPCPACQ